VRRDELPAACQTAAFGDTSNDATARGAVEYCAERMQGSASLKFAALVDSQARGGLDRPQAERRGVMILEYPLFFLGTDLA
jgi:hypothetical protein